MTTEITAINNKKPVLAIPYEVTPLPQLQDALSKLYADTVIDMYQARDKKDEGLFLTLWRKANELERQIALICPKFSA